MMEVAKLFILVVCTTMTVNARFYGREKYKLKPLDWWENTVVYEILVPSFMDSNGDGTGDLKGITSRLSYFAYTGIQTIWLTPIFESPMKDFGYDVSNFYKISKLYGTMADFDEMVLNAHKLGLKVVLDIVPNHASTDSEYFKCSEAKVPGYENYFVWSDPTPDPDNITHRLPPSNWESRFGGSIWEWSDKRQQYYLHQFAAFQADFNHRDPAVRKELINIISFWLDKGIDGIRMDAVNYLYEVNPQDFGGVYPDQPPATQKLSTDDNFVDQDRKYTRDLIENFDQIYDWRNYIDKWNENKVGSTRIMLTEAYGNITWSMMYYGDYADKPSGAHIPLNFDLITELNNNSSARDFEYIIKRWLIYMPPGHTANWQLANHDRPRIATAYGPKMLDGLSALILLLPGTAVTYQGEEIGMHDVFITLEQTKDPKALTTGILKYSRDPSRTPFQWDNTTSAGFSTNSTSWLPVASDYMSKNLQAQKEADRSFYKTYRSIVTLRKEPALSHGSTHIRALTKNTLIVIRYLKAFHSYALVFNVGKQPDEVDLTREEKFKEPMIVYASSLYSSRKIGSILPRERVMLEPGEALVLRLPET